MSSGKSWEVEKIVGDKTVNGRILYEVKWTGYKNTTWEPKKNIVSKVLITEYNEELRQKSSQNGGGGATPAASSKKSIQKTPEPSTSGTGRSSSAKKAKQPQQNGYTPKDAKKLSSKSPGKYSASKKENSLRKSPYSPPKSRKENTSAKKRTPLAASTSRNERTPFGSASSSRNAENASAKKTPVSAATGGGGGGSANRATRTVSSASSRTTTPTPSTSSAIQPTMTVDPAFTLPDYRTRELGFEKKLRPKKIMGATETNGRLLYLMMWEGTDERDLVFAEDANRKCPHLVIEFLQSKITWNAMR